MVMSDFKNIIDEELELDPIWEECIKNKIQMICGVEVDNRFFQRLAPPKYELAEEWAKTLLDNTECEEGVD